MVDALFRQQLAVGAVSHNDQRPGQLLAHLGAAGLALIDDLHAHAHVQQLVRQIVAHFTGTHDHYRRRLLSENAQILEKRGQMLRCGGDIDLVSSLELKITGGNGGLSLPGHGADQNSGPGIPVNVQQPHAVQSRPLRQAVFHQF